MNDQATPCSEMERYLFDLNGYFIIKGALSPEEVKNCNKILDDLQDIEINEWRRNVHGQSFTGTHEGLNLQQIYEAGDCLLYTSPSPRDS